jgi:hypothetical protein
VNVTYEGPVELLRSQIKACTLRVPGIAFFIDVRGGKYGACNRGLRNDDNPKLSAGIGEGLAMIEPDIQSIWSGTAGK